MRKTKRPIIGSCQSEDQCGRGRKPEWEKSREQARERGRKQENMEERDSVLLSRHLVRHEPSQKGPWTCRGVEVSVQLDCNRWFI